MLYEVITVCAPQGFWRVGALARRQLSPDPAPPPGRGIYANNTAQLQELELRNNFV